MASVLLVDDDTNFTVATSELLTILGHQIVIAVNSAQAARILATRQFDLLLLDLMLPDGSGLQVLENIPERQRPTHITIITGNSTIKSLGKRVIGPHIGYLMKPIGLGDLQVLINKSLAKAETPESHTPKHFGFLVGESPAMHKLYEMIERVIGIASDDMDKLFKPFAQVAGASSLRHQGTGLGLAISHQLVQYLGGEISVVSQPGIGSKFTLYIDPGDLAGVLRQALMKNSNLDTTMNIATICFDGHILVTDDLPDIRFLIGQLISSFGGRVSYASNGQEAITMVNEKAGQPDAFDLLIMDAQMPVMDGLTATRYLRAQGYDKPILALTAATLRGERERCLDAGCMNIWVNPSIR